MPSDRDILTAAHIIQSELETLMGSEARFIEPQLAQLIAQVEAGQTDISDLEEFLAEYDALRDRMATLLNLTESTTKSFSVRYHPLAGDRQIASAQKYICPQCDRLWYRRDTGQDIPQCPTHQVTLIPAPMS